MLFYTCLVYAWVSYELYYMYSYELIHIVFLKALYCWLKIIKVRKKIRYHSIGDCIEFCLITSHPQPKTAIFGQTMKFSDTPKINRFGHINMFTYLFLFVQ